MKYESFEVIMEDNITHDRVNLSFGRNTTVHDIFEVMDETHKEMCKNGGSGIVVIKGGGFLKAKSRDDYRELRRSFIMDS